eukprot:jgi/Bigna1/67073/fgenesh1_pg.3_\
MSQDKSASSETTWLKRMRRRKGNLNLQRRQKNGGKGISSTRNVLTKSRTEEASSNRDYIDDLVHIGRNKRPGQPPTAHQQSNLFKQKKEEELQEKKREKERARMRRNIQIEALNQAKKTVADERARTQINLAENRVELTASILSGATLSVSNMNHTTVLLALRRMAKLEAGYEDFRTERIRNQLVDDQEKLVAELVSRAYDLAPLMYRHQVLLARKVLIVLHKHGLLRQCTIALKTLTNRFKDMEEKLNDAMETNPPEFLAAKVIKINFTGTDQLGISLKNHTLIRTTRWPEETWTVPGQRPPGRNNVQSMLRNDKHDLLFEEPTIHRVDGVTAGGQAHSNGIRSGDIIVSVAGKRTKLYNHDSIFDQMRRAMKRARKQNRTFEVEFLRIRSPKSYNALGAFKIEFRKGGRETGTNIYASPPSNVVKKFVFGFGLSERDNVIRNVKSDGSAERFGARDGMHIVQVEDVRVRTPGAALKIMQQEKQYALNADKDIISVYFVIPRGLEDPSDEQKTALELLSTASDEEDDDEDNCDEYCGEYDDSKEAHSQDYDNEEGRDQDEENSEQDDDDEDDGDDQKYLRNDEIDGDDDSGSGGEDDEDEDDADDDHEYDSGENDKSDNLMIEDREENFSTQNTKYIDKKELRAVDEWANDNIV